MATCEVCLTPSEELAVTSGLLNKDMKLQRGGICTLLLTNCDAAAFDESDLAEWQTSVDSGETIVIRDCSLEVTFAEEATSVTRGCNAKEVVTNRTKTLTVSDVSDNTDFARAQLYNYMQRNPDAYKLAYMTYDGILYESARVTANPNRTIAANTEGFTEFVTIFTWKALESGVPIKPTWGADDIVLPLCTVRVLEVADLGATRQYIAVPTFASGATSATYVWRVNGVVVVGQTAVSATLTVVPTDTVTVTVTDNATPACVAVSPTLTVV
jgi:hypothetical protein